MWSSNDLSQCDVRVENESSWMIKNYITYNEYFIVIMFYKNITIFIL
jgi:hypothetical protein